MSFVFTFEALTVTLPSPIIGDSLVLVAGANFSRTRGGFLIPNRETTFPQFETFRYRWAALNVTQANDFRQFIQTSSGLQVGITDHKGDAKTGFIVTETIEFIELPNDRFEVSLDFMEEPS